MKFKRDRWMRSDDADADANADNRNDVGAAASAAAARRGGASRSSSGVPRKRRLALRDNDELACRCSRRLGVCARWLFGEGGCANAANAASSADGGAGCPDGPHVAPPALALPHARLGDVLSGNIQQLLASG